MSPPVAHGLLPPEKLITGFSLLNAATSLPLPGYENLRGEVHLRLIDLPPSLDVSVQTEGIQHATICIWLNGSLQAVDRSAPYRLTTGMLGVPWNPSRGVYTISAAQCDDDSAEFPSDLPSSLQVSFDGGTMVKAAERIYYVATNGDDSNGGTSLVAPFRTLQRAADIVNPGDLVLVREGSYPILLNLWRSGTRSEPIYFEPYSGEHVVLDGTDQAPNVSTHQVWVMDVAWNVFRGFEVRNSPQQGVRIDNGSHDNIFEDLELHGNHGSGIAISNSDRNHLIDIVSYDNYDSLNPRQGDDADGISILSGDANVISGCRVFFNSDDGVDAWQSTNTVIQHCISSRNGRGTHGNGNGFKAGGDGIASHTIVRNCIAYSNRSKGFDYNTAVSAFFVNDTAVDNGGPNFIAANGILINNVSYYTDGNMPLWLDLGSNVSTHNNWNLPIPTAAFQSLDPSAPQFLIPTASSIVVDKGMPVAVPYAGLDADLGAVELVEPPQAQRARSSAGAAR